MKRRLFVLSAATVLLGWLILLPAPVCGQGNTWAGTSLAQMVEAARWRVGALRLNAALELTSAGYDSDIYFGYLDEPVPDYTFLASLPVQVLLPLSKRVVLDLFDSPQYLFYLETKRERAWNNMFRGRVYFALEKFFIQAGGGLANVRQRMSPELNINIRQKTNSVDGLVLWQASRATSFALLYGGATYDYGDAEHGGTSIAERLNRKESYFDLVAYLQPNPRVRFFLDGQYGTYAFPQESVVSRDARSYGVFGGFEFVPREGEVAQAARFQGSVSLGYMRFDMKDPQFVDGSGLAGEVNLSAELLRRTTARAFFSRGFEFSIYSGASYYTSTAYGGGITRLLSKRVSLSYDLSFGRSSYPGNETGGGVPPGISNRYTTHMVSLNIMLARNLTITFLGTIAKRVPDETGPSRNRNFFGFNLIYGVATGTISAPTSGLSR